VDARAACIPPSLGDSLLPFQRVGVRFALERGGRALIADEMGLGKTLQGLATAAAFKDEWPLLILAPSSLRLSWAAEIINVVLTGKDPVDKGAITIISYDLLARCAPRLKACNFKVVLADESHYLKSPAAQRTKATLPLLRAASRAILLTGTPALSRPAELFSQLQALRPKLFPSARAFYARYCNARQGPFGLDISGASNLHELNVVLGGAVMIRRLKKDVLTQLPAKRRQQVFLELPAAAKARLATTLGKISDLKSKDAARASSSVFAESGEAKTAAAAAYVAELLEGGCGKLLVFAHHIAVLDGIEAAVVRLKVKLIRIDGSVKPVVRAERVEAFQTDPDIKVAVLGITAAGTGLTLTAASTVVFAELHWTPGLLVQAEDRVHRIGQRAAVNVHYLLARGSVDDLIWPSVVRKLRV
ncbi:P-loop containing nucleoside triphosphate hydrolase protein, partial [Baffinella frigidus]